MDDLTFLINLLLIYIQLTLLGHFHARAQVKTAGIQHARCFLDKMSANGTSNVPPSVPMSKALTVYTSLLIMFTALAGHALVILAIYRRRDLRSFANLIILNLSVTDILFALIIPPTQIMNVYRFRFSTKGVFCDFLGIITVLLVNVSCNTLAFVSAERFLATNYPLKHLRYITAKAVGTTVVLIWLWSSIIAIYPILTSRYGYIEDFFHCTVDWNNDLPTSVAFIAIGNALPLLIVVYCKHQVLNAAKGSAIGTRNSTSLERMRMQQERQISVVISVIIISFMAFNSPYIVSICCALIENCNLSPEYVWSAVVVAGFSCSANPVIYGVMNAKFRRVFKELLCCK